MVSSACSSTTNHWVPRRMVRHRAAPRAGIPEWATFHDPTHFYASLLIAKSQLGQAVQKRLDHQSAIEHLTPTAISGRIGTTKGAKPWTWCSERCLRRADAVLIAASEPHRPPILAPEPSISRLLSPGSSEKPALRWELRRAADHFLDACASIWNLLVA